MPGLPGEGDFEPIKRGGAQGGHPPAGGGAPGPGGGFGGAFGGGGFFGSDIGSGGGVYGLPRRRIVMGPNGPVSVASSPMSTDTVPAMLTPGEGVLNVGAMRQPGVPEMMQAANRIGMAEGGIVPGAPNNHLLALLLQILNDWSPRGVPPDASGNVSAAMSPAMFNLHDGGHPAMMPWLMRAALDNSGLEAPGGLPTIPGVEVRPQVQGFAYGGMVRPQAGGYAQMPAGTPRMPAVGLAGRGMAPRPSPKFGGPTGQPQPFAPGGQMGPIAPPQQTTMPVQPGVAAPPSPWSGDPRAAGSQNPGDEWMARMWEFIRQFGDAGMFSPEGSPAVMNAVRAEASQNADALRQRARTNADLSGLDAGQRGSYAMQSDLGTQGDVANILSDAHLKQLLGQQQFGQQMFGNMSEAQMQAWLARLASWMKGGG